MGECKKAMGALRLHGLVTIYDCWIYAIAARTFAKRYE
jgi:hypothetical protein